MGIPVELIPRYVSGGRRSRYTRHRAVDLLDHGSHIACRDRHLLHSKGDMATILYMYDHVRDRMISFLWVWCVLTHRKQHPRLFVIILLGTLRT